MGAGPRAPSQPATSNSACSLCIFLQHRASVGLICEVPIVKLLMLVGPLLASAIASQHLKFSAGKAADSSDSHQRKCAASCLVQLRTSQVLKCSAGQGTKAGGPQATSAGSCWSTLTTPPLRTQLQMQTPLSPNAVGRQHSACEVAIWQKVEH